MSFRIGSLPEEERIALRQRYIESNRGRPPDEWMPLIESVRVGRFWGSGCKWAVKLLYPTTFPEMEEARALAERHGA